MVDDLVKMLDKIGVGLWRKIDSAPKDRPFLAWYDSNFGPKFGTMQWEPEVDPKTHKPFDALVRGRFQSMTMGTQTKCATYWMDPEAPRVWG